MRCRYPLLLSAGVLLILSAKRGEKCFAQGVPISNNYDISQGIDIKNNILRANDQDVQELEKLKAPSEGQYESISMMKTHESSYINENGKEKSVAKLKQQYKNGKLLAKLEQKVSSKDDHSIGGKSDTKIQLSVDIPSKGIHKQTSYAADNESLRKRDGKYREYDKRNYDSLFPPPMSPYFNVEATPEDMAEYIFFTKDDKSVTQTIEKLIQEGRLDRESALAYLGMIDRELYRLDARYSDPVVDVVHKDIGNPTKLQNTLELSDFNEIDGSLTELKEMQQILRDKFSKKSKDLDKEDYNSKRIDRIRKILEAKLRMSDLQYNRLLETPSDYTYAQTMMDEIIYQLAKLMFNQGLFIGGSEAQESLKKFTDFLETEVNRGRISRALEKKILDLLIISLSDTLTEHPELMAAAKEGFSKYLDAYSNSGIESNAVDQKIRDNSKMKRDVPPINKKAQLLDNASKTSTMSKRSMKASGIEDNDSGNVVTN